MARPRRSPTWPTSRSPRAEIRRLEELRVEAAELAIDADLAAVAIRRSPPKSMRSSAENPLRERLHAQRMLALYRCGRQAEALEAYRDARRTLVEEIGVEPGPELRRLHEAILRQDPSLDVEPAAAELPRELDAAASPPLVGRDGELRRLRARWQRAATGAGALVTLVGAYGMGKTRLAAAIAADAHARRRAVLYAAGTGPPEAALAAIARTRDSRRPTLLVLDDVDRAPAEVRAALRELAPALARLPALVLATGQEAAALARLEPRDSITLEPLDAEAVARDRRLLRSGRGDDAVPGRDAARRERRRRAARARGGERVGAARGDAPRRRGRGPRGGRPQRGPRARGRAGRQRRRPAVGARARRAARGAGADAEAAVVCPYKGLATFDTDDAEYFFGREQLVAELVARLVGAPLLAVVGPSGSGKSSVVRAGLLPALAGGVLPGSERWARALIRPGEHPMRELARARPIGSRRPARRARGRPVRGAVHRLPGRAGARRVRRRARPRRSRRGPRQPRRARGARRLLRPLRRVPRALARCSAPTTCWSDRCRATSCAGRSSGPRSASG